LALSVTACGSDWLGTNDVIDDVTGDVAVDAVADSTQDVTSDALEETISDVAGDALADVYQGPEIVYWEKLPAIELTGGIYDQVPSVFSRISSYTTEIQGANPPDPSFLGASGVGNGLVFALFGYGVPTNSMHGFAGPGYDLAESFFGDYSLRLSSDVAAAPFTFDIERVARSLNAPVVITVGTVGDLELHTADFAPWFDGTVEPGSDSNYLRHCVIRNVTVRNTGDSGQTGVTVVVTAFGEVSSPADGVFVEEEPTRMLVTRVAGGTGIVSGNTLTVPVGDIESGQESSFVLTHCAFEPGTAVELPEIDVVALLQQTGEAWQAWESTLVDVVTPDPMVNDFIDEMKLSLKLQTSEGGATCPMSEYTRTWTRDNMGPVLAMLSLGGFEEVEGYLDYVYYGILREGDLKNSYPANLEIDFDSVTVPDWASMPPLGDGSIGKKRVSAETPSYMVMMYGLHNRFTGKTDRIVDRVGLLAYRNFHPQKASVGRVWPGADGVSKSVI